MEQLHRHFLYAHALAWVYFDFLLESIAYLLQFATHLNMQYTVATTSTNRNSRNTPATAPMNYRAGNK